MSIASVENATGITLLIQNTAGKVICPAVLEGVQWSVERKGAPSKLTFQVINDGLLNFEEGNIVALNVNGTDVFLGFVFTKARTKDGIISVTAYDQIRYLKSKSVLIYAEKKASEVIKMLAEDFKLKLGDIEDTGYTIPKRNESNVALIDMMQYALDLTLQNTKKMYVLYDDFGKLCLKSTENMLVDIVIDSETAENYSYESSIDKQTYNKIKLFFDNKDTGKRELYVVEDSESQVKWGIIQLCESLNERQTQNAPIKAAALLKLYNRKSRRLLVQNAFGDVRVRGGSGVWVRLNLEDITIDKRMLVESVTHKFNNNEHIMDLELRGGDIDE